MALKPPVSGGKRHDGTLSVATVEIESASLDYPRDQNKKGNKIPVVSVSDRGKQMGNYGTSSCIYTVDYEIKGENNNSRECTLGPVWQHILCNIC